MSTKKISALTALSTTPAAGDLLPIVDISDTTDAASGTTKSIVPATVFKAAGIGAGNTTAEPIIIDTTNGRMGIRNSSPGVLLALGGGGVDGNATFYSGMVQISNGGTAAGTGVYSPASNELGFVTDSTERARFDDIGRFGIGTANPGGQLEVEVADAANRICIRVDQNDVTNNPYAIYIENAGSGDSINDDSGAKLTAAGVFTDASDQFKKKNISSLSVGLSEVLQLVPKKFKYKKDNSVGVGFLAQDMEKIIPDVVHGDNAEIKDVVVQEAVEAKAAVKNNKGEITEPAVEAKDEIIEKNKMVGGKSIAYGSFTAVLVKAIQELSAKVTALENA